MTIPSGDLPNRRAQLGRRGPGPYAVVDGRLLTDGLEVVVAHHCNLQCRACAFLSPIRPRELIDPAQLQRDLSFLARRYHASEVRVLGGEPLLHPELDAVLEVIRLSGVCDSIRVMTNGLLLTRMGPGFWSGIDAASVSMYPNRSLDSIQMANVRRTAERFGVRINFKPFRYFRESYTETGTSDPALVMRIFRTCQMANVWRCHTLWEGYLFRCPQSLFLPVVLNQTRSGEPVDGLALADDRGFLDRLLRFLESDRPPWSCTYCLGSVGRPLAHEQVPRREWRARQSDPTEALVDWKHLALLEDNPGMLVLDASHLTDADT